MAPYESPRSALDKLSGPRSHRKGLIFLAKILGTTAAFCGLIMYAVRRPSVTSDRVTAIHSASLGTITEWHSIPSANETTILNESTFEGPLSMCDPDGVCYERPDVASPRTRYSSKTFSQYEQWWKYHEELKGKAQTYALHMDTDEWAKKHKQRPLVLYGDSITESWAGTEYGGPSERAKDVPLQLQKLREGDHFEPLPLAIAGDQTQHLLYRLTHGELPDSLARDPRAVFVVLIGTNNLGTGMLPEDALKGVLEVARFLLSHTRGLLVLSLLLPRGDGWRLAKLCPPRCQHTETSHGNHVSKAIRPFVSFMPAVNKVNDGLQRALPGLKESFGDRLALLDCGAAFSTGDIATRNHTAIEVKTELMPDSLHPNAAGHAELATCITQKIHESRFP